MEQRLIDANSIEYHKVWIETSIEGQHDGCIIAYQNQINRLPTVKAISVEWIKSWANKNCIEYLDYDGHSVPAAANDSWYDIANMIEDWEKENAKIN